MRLMNKGGPHARTHALPVIVQLPDVDLLLTINVLLHFFFFVFAVLFFSPHCLVACKQGELEKLNQSTDDINRWESELEVRQKQHPSTSHPPEPPPFSHPPLVPLPPANAATARREAQNK